MDSYVFNTPDGIVLRQERALASKLHYFRLSLLLLIFITLSLLVCYPLPVYANNLSVKDVLNKTIISMNTAMSSTPMIGNPDVDVAVMIIPHHQGAVEMAKVELRYGIDSPLRPLAQEIIVTQQSEIA